MIEGQKIPAALLQNQEGIPINSIEDWLRLAPPRKGKEQWRHGRSAAELALCWFRSTTAMVPHELVELFDSHPDTQGLVVEQAIPEKKTRLDDFKGETRNSDLVLVGRAGSSVVVVGIEAKADEPFGDLIGEYARKTKQNNQRSNVPRRISLLLDAVFAGQSKEDSGRLRYQLLHGFAATLIEANDRNASLAVFVVHEFVTDEVDEDKLEANRRDIRSFTDSFPELRGKAVRPGVLLGPVRVGGGQFVPNHIPAYIGTVVTERKSGRQDSQPRTGHE